MMTKVAITPEELARLNAIRAESGGAEMSLECAEALMSDLSPEVLSMVLEKIRL